MDYTKQWANRHDAACERQQVSLIQQVWRYAEHRRGCDRVMLIEIEKNAPCSCGFDDICTVMDRHNQGSHCHCYRRWLEARLLQVREILVSAYMVRNVVGDDICDLCGGDIKWPNHQPYCEIGKVLALLPPTGAGDE